MNESIKCKEKMYLQYKKQKMFDTNDLKKAGALWQTLHLSSASCD